MRKILLALAAGAILLGCGAAPPPPPSEVVLPAKIAAPAPEGDVPFAGTYQKRLKLTYEDGRLAQMPNDTSPASLVVEPARVVYEQSYTEDEVKRHIKQVYAFGTADVRATGTDRYDVALAFRTIEGDTQVYAADRNEVRLVAQRGPSGWDLALFMKDTSGRGVGVGFRDGSPEDPGTLAALVANVPGSLPPPPDVGAPPADAVQVRSGLFSKVLAAGKGAEHPALEDTVQIHSTTWSRDGRMLSSTVVRQAPDAQPLSRFLPGIQDGVALMVVGERRRLWIDAALAGSGAAVPPLFAGDLVVDVELLEIDLTHRPAPAPPDVKAPPASAKKTRSGLAYRLLKKGTGRKSPGPKDSVTVTYTGWTTDGKMFDTTTSRGPASFPLPAVIKGWSEALQLMKVGDSIRVWIPPDLAYGEHPRAGAPSGTLVFEIELLSIP